MTSVCDVLGYNDGCLLTCHVNWGRRLSFYPPDAVIVNLLTTKILCPNRDSSRLATSSDRRHSSRLINRSEI